MKEKISKDEAKIISIHEGNQAQWMMTVLKELDEKISAHYQEESNRRQGSSHDDLKSS